MYYKMVDGLEAGKQIVAIRCGGEECKRFLYLERKDTSGINQYEINIDFSRLFGHYFTPENDLMKAAAKKGGWRQIGVHEKWMCPACATASSGGHDYVFDRTDCRYLAVLIDFAIDRIKEEHIGAYTDAQSSMKKGEALTALKRQGKRFINRVYELTEPSNPRQTVINFSLQHRHIEDTESTEKAEA